MKALGSSGYIDGVALILEVTDEQLVRIRDDNKFWFDTQFLAECFKATGPNAHVYHLYLDHDGGDRLLDGIKRLEMDYKSISWWDKATHKFNYLKGRDKDVA
jgi:hypothetical protein